MYLHGLVDAAGTYELAIRGVAAPQGKTGNPDDAAVADSMLGAAYCLRSDQSAVARISEASTAWLA